jgi:hypothetical protein
MTNSFQVDISPDISTLGIFKNLSFTPWYAIGEFVDNSITSAIKDWEKLIKANGVDYKLRISINFDKEKEQLIIEDNAGGITSENLKIALRTGKPPADISIGLSRHGVGLKAAGFWWGPEIDLETWSLEEQQGWKVKLVIPGAEITSKLVDVKPLNMNRNSGTKVIISRLHQKMPQSSTVAAIKSYLPSIYRQYISSGYRVNESLPAFSCEIRYQNQILNFNPPDLLNEPFWEQEGVRPESSAPFIYWKSDFEYTFSTGKKIKGWIGILEKMSRDLSGFFLHYRGKGVMGVAPFVDKKEGRNEKEARGRSGYRPVQIFGQAGSYPYQSYIGEFDVSDFGKTITTDQTLWTVEEENEFLIEILKVVNDRDKNMSTMIKNFKRKVKNAPDEEATIKILKTEAENFQETYETVELTHNPGKDEPISQEDISSSEQIGMSITDIEGHNHKFKISFIKDASAPFIGLKEDHTSMEHNIYINIFHPAISDLMVEHDDIEKLLIRLAFGMGSSEALMSSFDKSLIRNKMNEILRDFGTNRIRKNSGNSSN